MQSFSYFAKGFLWQQPTPGTPRERLIKFYLLILAVILIFSLRRRRDLAAVDMSVMFGGSTGRLNLI